jgi:hypothetical protein
VVVLVGERRADVELRRGEADLLVTAVHGADADHPGVVEHARRLLALVVGDGEAQALVLVDADVDVAVDVDAGGKLVEIGAADLLGGGAVAAQYAGDGGEPALPLPQASTIASPGSSARRLASRRRAAPRPGRRSPRG